MLRKNLFVKVLAAAAILTLILGLSAVVYGANTSSDPLVTLSYLNGTYKSGLLAEVNTAVAAKQKQLSAEFSEQASGLSAGASSSKTEVAANDYETVTLTSGQSVSLLAGGEVLFLSGSATVDTAALTDATAGNAVAAGGALTANHLYVASGDCAIQASGNVKFLVK